MRLQVKMSEESAVKLKPFSDKREDWVYWAPMFLVHANAKDYHGIAEGDNEVPNNNDVLDPRADVYRIKLKLLNKSGYSELMALMSHVKVVFMLVHKSCTARQSNRSLFEVWKNLKAWYEPVDVETVQDVIKKYNECHLEENKDPEKWVIQKDKICFRLQIDFGKKDYKDEDFKAAVVYSLPEPYHLEKVLLKDKYKLMHIQDNIMIVEAKEEKAMAAKENNQSCIICWHCCKYGHERERENCQNKNDGKPVVIQPWSRNQKGGQTTTMAFADTATREVTMKMSVSKRNLIPNSTQ